MEKIKEVINLLFVLALLLGIALIAAFPKETVFFFQVNVLKLVSSLQAEEGQDWFHFFPFFLLALCLTLWLIFIVWSLSQNKKVLLLLLILFPLTIFISASRYVGLDQENIILYRFWQEKKYSLDQVEEMRIDFREGEEEKEVPRCQPNFSLQLKNGQLVSLTDYAIDQIDFFSRIKKSRPEIKIVCRMEYWPCQENEAQALCDQMID